MGSTRVVVVVLAALVAGCSVESRGSDGGTDASSAADLGSVADSGGLDTGSATDSGIVDSGGGIDAGSATDSGAGGGADSSCTANFAEGPSCGDGLCDVTETCLTCTADCGCCGDAGPIDPTGAVCGNGSCETGETCTTCSDDCGVCH